ncbi:MAG: DUF503 domain-containing protein [Thermodesulfovibrionia bacterium]
MIVGLLTLDLHLLEADSLKAKRFVIKGLKDRIRSRFNVSISEVDGHDLWQRSILGIAYITNEKRMIDKTFEEIRRIVINTPSVEIIDSSINIL